MWVSLLGPLHVADSRTQRDVRAPKQRALLAALAVNANNVVHTDQLSEAMWGCKPPPSKEDTTRTYVHRLRRQLGTEGGQRIAVRPPGYILRIDPDELDLLRFVALATEGRACANASDWVSAAARLTEAEALWRGTPLIDIPTRTVHERYIRYLEQTRLAAQELRIEAEVRIARRGATGVIPELQLLITTYPERECLYLLLMLALYRAGRQAEALTVFNEARRFSVTEYGVDPGPELTQMHQRILAQDPALLSEPLGRRDLN